MEDRIRQERQLIINKGTERYRDRERRKEEKAEELIKLKKRNKIRKEKEEAEELEKEKRNRLDQTFTPKGYKRKSYSIKPMTEEESRRAKLLKLLQKVEIAKGETSPKPQANTARVSDFLFC